MEKVSTIVYLPPLQILIIRIWCARLSADDENFLKEYADGTCYI